MNTSCLDLEEKDKNTKGFSNTKDNEACEGRGEKAANERKRWEIRIAGKKRIGGY